MSDLKNYKSKNTVIFREFVNRCIKIQGDEKHSRDLTLVIEIANDCYETINAIQIILLFWEMCQSFGGTYCLYLHW
jgi:hypothetical protein